MKLRDHPLASYNGLSDLPPTWVRIDERSWTTLNTDEIGFLIHVRMFDLSECRVSIRMRHEQAEYIEHLQFDNHDFCLSVYAALRERIGSAIKDIGDIELE